MMFDLDEFKPINDLYGHESGDIVLKQITLSLSSQLRRNEVLYRIGGDEFALLLVNISDDEVKIIADRVVNLVRSLTFGFRGATVNVGCSMGIARYPVDADTPQALLQLADRAMYEAKNSDHFHYVITTTLTKRQLENEITTLVNNIQVFKSMGGDVKEHIFKLADYRALLYELNETELNALLSNVQS